MTSLVDFLGREPSNQAFLENLLGSKVVGEDASEARL